MAGYTEKVESLTLDVIRLRGIVAFPQLPMSFEITDSDQTELARKAAQDGFQVLLVAMKDPKNDSPDPDLLYDTGVTADVKSFIRLPSGGARILCEGRARADVLSYDSVPGGVRASVVARSLYQAEDSVTLKSQALMLETLEIFNEFLEFVPKPSQELLIAVKSIRTPGLLADFIALNALIKPEDKQQVLSAFQPDKRLEKLALLMRQELVLLDEERKLHRKIHERIDESQRTAWLQQQMAAIRDELGYDDYSAVGGDDEVAEYQKKVEDAKLPDEVAEKLRKEVKRLSKTQPMSPEAGVIKTYLDTCLEVPWTKTSKDRVDIAEASKILEKDHDGLEKVKQRILEFLAVKQLNPQINNQILCLVGPPGTGKTSVASSIARAMNRKFVRVSLGGIRDEADIRGHRKTYIGSMPGRIIDALIKCGVRNPVMLLDEVDKLGADYHGDPASALLEVLDVEQNKAFRDHYTELPVDLSECLFICTANTLETVPRPLIDRMEVIELKIYTRTEKLAIAKNHLIPKQLKRHGLNKRTLKIDDSALMELIDFYTYEAGVRNLEREIGSLCRKAAKKLLDEGVKSVKITAADISSYLGRRKVKPKKISDDDRVGVVNGMAYTELGGDLLQVECMAMPGDGKFELTGQLGDVMKESARLAISYIRANSDSLGIESDFYKTRDIHIHVPEGAVPKDGPSAGVTITTAIASELSHLPVRRDIAMTGEIDLRGDVLPIGGLREKTMAAYKAGVTTVLVPKDNEDDLEDIDPVVRSSVKFIECDKLSQVLDIALIKSDGASAGMSSSGKPSQA